MAALTAAQQREALTYPGVTVSWNSASASTDPSVPNQLLLVTTVCNDGRSNADFTPSNRTAC